MSRQAWCECDVDVVVRGMRHAIHGLYSSTFGNFELDRLRRRVEDDVKRLLASLQWAEHVGEETFLPGNSSPASVISLPSA